MIGIIERIQGMRKAIVAALTSAISLKVALIEFVGPETVLPVWAYVAILLFTFVATYTVPNKATAEAPAATPEA